MNELNELNNLQELEVKDLLNKTKADYCAEHCAEVFVSNKNLNKVLYIIGTVIVLISGSAVAWALPTATALGAQSAQIATNTKDIDSFKNIKIEADSILAVVNSLKNKK